MKIIREHLSVKISLQLVALAIPLLSVAVWRATVDERTAVEEMLLDRGRVAALSGAAAYSAVLESGVDSGALTLADLLDPHYEEIQFPVPVEDKRYHTKFDHYTDTHGIQQIEDAVLASSREFIYASGIDVRGYVPTPHKKYAEEPTGDLVRDRAVSRAKRKYDQPLHLAAAGYLGNEPTLVQDYHRDTGELVWDVAAPIYVKGKHFGAFRVGVVRGRVDVLTRALAIELARVLAVAVLLMGLAVFWVTRKSLHPLRELAVSAVSLSTTDDGSELRRKIRVTSSDEVGRIAKALDRMRLSMLGMWDREHDRVFSEERSSVTVIDPGNRPGSGTQSGQG